MADPVLPPQCHSGSVLPDVLANARKKLFTQHKLPALNPMVPHSGKEDSGIKIDLFKFRDLLIQFRDAKIYTGMRVYFATCLDTPGSPHVPGGREGHLTLIIVPTKPTTQGQTIGGTDDPKHYYHLYDDCRPLPVPSSGSSGDDAVTHWTGHFKNHRRPGLLKDGATVTSSSGFEETESLWYSIRTIAGDASDIGMIGSIQCGIDFSDNPVIGLTAEYCCFIEKEDEPKIYPFYQLSLMFELHQRDDRAENKMTFGSLSMIPLLGGKVDTGLPCPPAG